jgi:hypothetical protein
MWYICIVEYLVSNQKEGITNKTMNKCENIVLDIKSQIQKGPYDMFLLTNFRKAQSNICCQKTNH